MNTPSVEMSQMKTTFQLLFTSGNMDRGLNVVLPVEQVRGVALLPISKKCCTHMSEERGGDDWLVYLSSGCIYVFSVSNGWKESWAAFKICPPLMFSLFDLTGAYLVQFSVNLNGSYSVDKSPLTYLLLHVGYQNEDKYSHLWNQMFLLYWYATIQIN